MSDDPLWYKDAVFYELHVKAFQDSNGDGIGDFNGLIQRLDYVQSLGVDVIWLLPLPSPLRDDGLQPSSERLVKIPVAVHFIFHTTVCPFEMLGDSVNVWEKGSSVHSDAVQLAPKPCSITVANNQLL